MYQQSNSKKQNKCTVSSQAVVLFFLYLYFTFNKLILYLTLVFTTVAKKKINTQRMLFCSLVYNIFTYDSLRSRNLYRSSYLKFLFAAYNSCCYRKTQISPVIIECFTATLDFASNKAAMIEVSFSSIILVAISKNFIKNDDQIILSK